MSAHRARRVVQLADSDGEREGHGHGMNGARWPQKRSFARTRSTMPEGDAEHGHPVAVPVVGSEFRHRSRAKVRRPLATRVSVLAGTRSGTIAESLRDSALTWRPIQFGQASRYRPSGHGVTGLHAIRREAAAITFSPALPDVCAAWGRTAPSRCPPRPLPFCQPYQPFPAKA